MAAEVFFTTSPENIFKLFDKIKGSIVGKKIAIKTHFGEEGNTTFLNPKLVKIIYDQLKIAGFKEVNLIESNVLYQGQRTNAKSHIELAKRHGFDFTSIDIYDEQRPDDNFLVDLAGLKNFNRFYLIKNLTDYDFLVVVSHFKGHVAAGFGGAIKNLSMGLASRRGKLAMHANSVPEVEQENCIACGKCAKDCPVSAITLSPKAKINPEVCIGCAHCIAICPQKTIHGFSSGVKELQERMVEYAYAATKQINAVYFNFAVNLTAHCDCFGDSDKILTEDIGFLASTDPLAIDQASYDLVLQHLGKDIFEETNGVNGLLQLDYGEKIGLGNKNYSLINIK